MSGHREVLETWFKNVWSNEDADTIDKMLVPDTQARGLGSQTHVGPSEFKVFQKNLLARVSNVEIKIDKSMEDGDWLSALCTFTSTCRQTGKPASMTGHVMIKIVDRKLVDAYNHFDFMGLYESLGLMPAGSFERCLTGDGFR